MLKSVTPILLVRDVTESAAFYRDRLGFQIDFVYGEPPFYGSVSRDGVCLHLRFVRQPVFAEIAAREVSLVCATIEVEDLKTLFEEFTGRAAPFAQGLVRQDWGGTDFQVRDPDGNVVSFVTYDQASA